VNTAIHLGGHGDGATEGRRKQRHRVECRTIVDIGRRHQRFHCRTEGRRDWTVARAHCCEIVLGQAVRPHQRLGQVNAFHGQVIADVARDVGELHGVSKRARPFHHPRLVHAERFRHPEADHPRDAVRVCRQFGEIAIAARLDIHSHTSDQLVDVAKGQIVLPHVGHHAIDERHTAGAAGVRPTRRVEPRVPPHVDLVGTQSAASSTRSSCAGNRHKRPPPERACPTAKNRDAK
jgi:hypothetical protein